MHFHHISIRLLALAFLIDVSASFDFETFYPTAPDDECQITNEAYLKVIKEFYEPIDLISFYFIHPYTPNASKFELSAFLLEQIPRSNTHCLNQSNFI